MTCFKKSAQRKGKWSPPNKRPAIDENYYIRMIVEERNKRIQKEMETKKYYIVGKDKTPIERLPREVLVEIFSYVGLVETVMKYLEWRNILPLSSFEIENCCRVSRFFAECTGEQFLWKNACHEKYGKAIADSTIELYGGNWKHMALDDNKRGTLFSVDKAFGYQFYCWSKTYRCNIARRFILVGAQLHRSKQYLRVYIDVPTTTRGLSDTPHPLKSCSLKQDIVENGETVRWQPIKWTGNNHIASGHFKGYLTFVIDQPVENWRRVDFVYENAHVPFPFMYDFDSIKYSRYTMEENALALLQESKRQEDARWFQASFATPSWVRRDSS